jgi:hypothetical protein
MKTYINISNCFSRHAANQVMVFGREYSTPILDPKQFNGTPGKIS